MKVFGMGGDPERLVEREDQGQVRRRETRVPGRLDPRLPVAAVTGDERPQVSGEPAGHGFADRPRTFSCGHDSILPTLRPCAGPPARQHSGPASSTPIRMLASTSWCGHSASSRPHSSRAARRGRVSPSPDPFSAVEQPQHLLSPNRSAPTVPWSGYEGSLPLRGGRRCPRAAPLLRSSGSPRQCAPPGLVPECRWRWGGWCRCMAAVSLRRSCADGISGSHRCLCMADGCAISCPQMFGGGI